MNQKIIYIALGVGVVILALLVINRPKKPEFKQTQTTVQQNQQGQLPTASPRITEQVIEVTDRGFVPSQITIKAGTKVVWVNKSGESVSLNSDEHPTHQLYPPLNLGAFDNGSSVQLVFDKAGKYGFHNHFKPEQKGSVVVQ